MRYPTEYVNLEKLGVNPYEEPLPDETDFNASFCGAYCECSIDNLLSPYKEYFTLFPDDKPVTVGYHICGSVSASDKINAYQWGIEHRRHWWEYPDLHPELVPGYWEKLYKEHPDWEF